MANLTYNAAGHTYGDTNLEYNGLLESSSSSSCRSSSSSSSSSCRSSSSSSSSSSSQNVPKAYTRESVDILPADDTNLATAFSAQDYIDVGTENYVYVAQDGVWEYPMFLFKDNKMNIPLVILWKGKSEIAPSLNTVYLQVYNRTITTWIPVASDNLSGAGSNFTLTGTLTTNLSDYYDVNGWISCRVYQADISSSSSRSSSSSSCRSSSSSSSSSTSSSSSSCRSSSSSSSSSSRSSSSSSSSCRSSSSSSSSSSCRSSSSSSSSQSPCWVAAEIFGGWMTPKTCSARYYVNEIGPIWFKNFYIKNGKQIAKFIHDKPIFKLILRPLFEYFVYRGRKEIVYATSRS